MDRIGPSALLSFDPTFWENAEKTKTWTFQERMDEIIDLLTHYKSRVDTLYRGDRRGARQKHQNTKVSLTSTYDNSTNMELIELAVEAMEAQGEGK
jgi:hypothetical protein